jgi:Domain of unknown function (DUF4129)
MRARAARTGAVAIAVTMLVSVVAIAGREPIRGTTAQPNPARPAPDTYVPITPDFPVPGALPPEVIVIEPEEDSGLPPWLGWTIAAIGAAAIVAAGVVLGGELRRLWPKRGRRDGDRPAVPEATVAEPPGADTENDPEAARHAVDRAMERLRDAADARAAVIEAYARMEEVLAEEHLGRRSPEAPREYLARVLREQDIPGQPLTTLTALFEEARFSLHPIPDSARSRALSELEDARVALAEIDKSG